MKRFKKYNHLLLLSIQAFPSVFFINSFPDIQNLFNEGIFIYSQVKNNITRTILQHLQLQQNHQEDNLEWHR